jgi:mevalonate kinase
VRELYDHDTQRTQIMLHGIGSIVSAARDLIAEGDLVKLGYRMGLNHTLLRQLGVSSPELDTLVDAAHRAGALGAKLSGGGRGGNMIALVTAEARAQVETALRAAGAVRVLTTEVS